MNKLVKCGVKIHRLILFSGSPIGPIHFNCRYVTWKVGKNVCAGKWVREVCVAGVGDLHKAVSSTGVFINKLYFDFQPLALDCLEEYQRNQTLRSAVDPNYGKTMTMVA
jgi:hypothetical protein